MAPFLLQNLSAFFFFFSSFCFIHFFVFVFLLLSLLPLLQLLLWLVSWVGWLVGLGLSGLGWVGVWGFMFVFLSPVLSLCLPPSLHSVFLTVCLSICSPMCPSFFLFFFSPSFLASFHFFYSSCSLNHSNNICKTKSTTKHVHYLVQQEEACTIQIRKFSSMMLIITIVSICLC